MVKKQSNMPKRPAPAYGLFIAHMKEKDADLDFAERSRKNAKRWKAMTPEEKAPFEREYERLKKEYVEKMRHYIPQKGDKIPKAHSDKPKRPLSSFFCFLADYRVEVASQNLTPPEITKKGKVLWAKIKEQNPKKYQKYQKCAAEAQERYHLAMEKWRAKMARAGVEVPPPRKRTPKKTVATKRLRKSARKEE